MGRPSKLTAEVRERILEAKRVGASNKTAALVAGIDESTLRSHLKKGEAGPPESPSRKFYEDFQQAAAHPRERALGIIYNALPDRPDLAWKYVERREEGYAPPVQAPVIAQQPVSITLSFFEPQSLSTVEVVDVEPAEPDSTPAPALAARPPRRPA